ncbi:MAG: tyrosine-type recombinase/integrase, partial [Alphaproteobacteria bacterium]|nr:tyrosine-type recombinase/integrase [Alphaproteobacteria bacterium]
MPARKPAIPVSHRPAGDLDDLAETARSYAREAKAPNTVRAYAADWRHYTRWCMARGVVPLPPDPQAIGLYLADCAAALPSEVGTATIERRLSGLAWNFRQRGLALDRADRHIREVLAGIRRRHARPPVGKEALLADDLMAMLDLLGHDLRGLRDRALLLVGFAGGLRRSEIVGLDIGEGDGTGRVEALDEGLVLRVKGKTGWRVVEVGRGSAPRSCPVEAVRAWTRFARIVDGPLFRRLSRDGKVALDQRLSDRHVSRLVARLALAAGLRGDLPEGRRRTLFAGHSLRAGLASSAEVEERHVQAHLGHATAEMTRR